MARQAEETTISYKGKTVPFDRAEGLIREGVEDMMMDRPRVLEVPRLERHLATGGNPEQEYPVPQFAEDFLATPDLEEIAEALITLNLAKFSHLRPLTVLYLWKRQGGVSKGRTVLGTCQKPSGLVKHFSEADWVICLAADNCRGMTRWQVEATLYHELCHCGEDVNTGDPVVYGHDAEMFRAEIEAYGLWKSDLVEVGDTFAQLPLFGKGS